MRVVSGKIIGKIMYDKRVNQADIAKSLGIKWQSSVSESLKRNMRISTFVKMMDALGYDVIVRERHVWRIMAEKTEVLVTDGIGDGEEDG